MKHGLMLLLVLTLAGSFGCASMQSSAPSGRSTGWQVPLGNGTAVSYAEFDSSGVPAAIGVAFSAQALDGLPVASNNHHCTERNKDGAIVADTKCQHTVEE